MPNIYESDTLLSEYLLMHYGSREQLMPWKFGPSSATGFPARTVGYFPDIHGGRALDLGCAVGASAYELSKSCNEVIGIDFSASFIKAAEQLRTGGKIDFSIRETGNLTSTATASLPQGTHPERVSFLQGDAMNLPRGLGSFERVHAANLICRLPDPRKLLSQLPSLVNTGGHLVLATPCTWLEEYTPADCQPHGDTFEWLSAHLADQFSLLQQAEEPFLIRETSRKFQWTVSLVTLWQRKP